MALTLRENDVLRKSVYFELRKGIHPDLESKGYGKEKEGKAKGRPEDNRPRHPTAPTAQRDRPGQPPKPDPAPDNPRVI